MIKASFGGNHPVPVNFKTIITCYEKIINYLEQFIKNSFQGIIVVRGAMGAKEPLAKQQNQ